MKIYSIFDDFGEQPLKILQNAGMEVSVHPQGVPRPDFEQMKKIFENYDGVIIGTSQKMPEEIFENISTHKVIATASVGMDHISIPDEKKELITVLNTPNANAQSVSEFTIGCALSCCKRFVESRNLYMKGMDNKKLTQKPEDLYGKTLGVIGAGNISCHIMKLGEKFGMNVISWTAHPDKHRDISNSGVKFVELDDLLRCADVISVNLPNKNGTKNFISEKRIQQMKKNAIFISISRKETIDYVSLFKKAKNNLNFYVCLDLDIDDHIVKCIPEVDNVIVTPHIAGGTIETRKRMFRELAEQLSMYQKL